jgi:hypothetical protein
MTFKVGQLVRLKPKWYDIEFQLFGTKGKERQITGVRERDKYVFIGGFSFSYSEIELAEPRKLHKRYLRGI